MGNPLLNAPIAMISSLTIAILFAVGHHLFNWSLQRPGQVVPTSTFGQGINTSAGTAFAFLVKAALTMALGTAYTQLLFDTLLRNTLSVEITDVLTGMLASIVQVCRVNLTWRYPCVLLLAVVYQLIALSTIVPPGTLSVSLRTMYDTAELAVPDLNWDFIETAPFSDNEVGLFAPFETDTLYFSSSDLDISNIVSTTVLNNRIPPLPAFALNSSYELDVVGPAVQCTTQDVNSQVNLKNWQPYCPSDDLPDWVGGIALNTNLTGATAWVGYMAWIPNIAHFNGSTEPNVAVNNDTFMPFYPNSSILGFNNSQQVDCTAIAGTAQIQSPIAFIDPNFQLDIAMAISDFEDQVESWTWTRCTLTNATYQILFNFSDTAQTVTVRNRTLTDLEKTLYTGPDELGEEESFAYNNASFNYINLMTSFSQLIAGVIDTGNTQSATPQIFRSEMFTSTNEFQTFLKNYYFSTFSFGTSNSTGALAPFLEDLFTNVTVAMFTQRHEGLTTAQASVTTWRTVQVYNYSWQHLVLSYGIGIILTSLAVVYGCIICHMRNGASYSLAFSTFLRITPWNDVGDLLAATNEPHVGANPVPPTLAATKLKFGKVNASESELVVKPPASVNVDVSETSSMLSAFGFDAPSTEPLRRKTA